MIIDEKLELNAPIGSFLEPDNRIREILTEDFERGSASLNNPTGGLLQDNWRVYSIGTNIYLNKLLADNPKLIFTTSIEPTEVNFAFDSNMKPQVVYVEGGQVKFRWFDSVLEDYTTTVYTGIISPRLSLDDKRPLQGSNRDILLLYIKTGSPLKLCYRQQRDRYETERELYDLPDNTIRLGRFGKADTNRVQIEYITQNV